jgi:hypothetical protein
MAVDWLGNGRTERGIQAARTGDDVELHPLARTQPLDPSR